MPEITLVDPRQVDGEPYEVAHEAGNQLVKVLDAAAAATDAFNWAARGAWMTAEEHRTGEMPDGHTFADTAQGEKLTKLYDDLCELTRVASVLRDAAGWNPRSQV